jgi:hypothetical protein
MIEGVEGMGQLIPLVYAEPGRMAHRQLVSRRTVASDWVMAKGWLYRVLRADGT